MRVVFAGLKIFSSDGGIEQVARNWIGALHELSTRHKFRFQALSLYDANSDEAYLPFNLFSGSSNRRVHFLISLLKHCWRADVLIISHIHLALPALLIKIVNPRIKLIIQLHGIEAWNIQSFTQKLVLRIADELLAVSQYTKSRLEEKFAALRFKISVLHNSLSPVHHYNHSKELYFSARAQLNISNEYLVCSIGRLNSSERYKGHEKVLEALAMLGRNDYLFYIIGQYDAEEYQRISSLIVQHKTTERVRMLGFISNDQLKLIYQASDVLAMPSVGEGFGLVFIEAMAFGLPVIAGNQDGSTDAVIAHPLGRLVNPQSPKEISKSLDELYTFRNNFEMRADLSQRCRDKFSNEVLLVNIEQLIFKWM